MSGHVRFLQTAVWFTSSFLKPMSSVTCPIVIILFLLPDKRGIAVHRCIYLCNFNKKDMLITDLEAPVSQSVNFFAYNGLNVGCWFLAYVYVGHFIV